MRLYFARKKAIERLEKKRHVNRYLTQATGMNQANSMLIIGMGSEAMPMTKKEERRYLRRMAKKQTFFKELWRWCKWFKASVRWELDASWGQPMYDKPTFRKSL
jgi:hypothetical protein